MNRLLLGIPLLMVLSTVEGAVITTVPIMLTTPVGDSITIGSSVLQLGQEFTVPITVSVAPDPSPRGLGFEPAFTQGGVFRGLLQPILTEGVETGFLNWKHVLFLTGGGSRPGWELHLGVNGIYANPADPDPTRFNMNSMLDENTGAMFIGSNRIPFQGSFGETVELQLTFTLLPAGRFTALPEPSTYGLVGLGLLALLARGRRSNRSRIAGRSGDPGEL